MGRTINEWATAVHDNSHAKGWWDGVAEGDPSVVPEKLCLIHSEVSEALEVYRAPELADPDAEFAFDEPMYLSDDGSVYSRQDNADGVVLKPVGFDSELADVVIRVLDLAAHLGIDMERAIVEKHAYNATRERRHGGKRC